VPRTLLADGRTVHWSEGGDPGGTPVLFFHGTPDTRRASWSGYAAAQRAGVRLIAANRPGYGASTPAAASYRRVVDDVLALADSLGLATFGVLGMSVGGPYALACAALAPARVSAAAVVGSPGEVTRMEPPWPRDALDEQGQELFRRLAVGTVEQNLEAVRPDFLAYRARVDPEDPDDVALAARWIGGLPPEDRVLLAGRPAADLAADAREALLVPDGYLADAALVFRPWDFRVDAVRCPVTLWYGERDAQSPPRHGTWLAAALQRATLHVRPGLGHLETLLRSWDEILTSVRVVQEG
jgi:pimeloyl-ACP methyl ester carboxylesterase